MKKIFIKLAALFSLILLIPFSSHALEMKAGVAKAVITPKDYQGRILTMGGPAKAVKHDIYARVLSLNDGSHRLIIVTYDLNCLDVATPILRARVLHELGIDPAYLLLMATHNHDAPIQIVPANFDYGRELADQIFGLIKEAIANEQGPVKLYFGSGQGNFLQSDPRYPQVYGPTLKPIDTEVQLLKVMQGDKVVAMLFNQPTHPMQSTFSEIEPGHPGYAVEELEQRLPGTMAMYADACGADQFPTVGTVMWAPLWRVKQLSHKLADTVLQISAGKLQDVTGPLSSSFSVISLPLAAPMSYEDALALVKTKKIPTKIGFVPYPEPDRDTNWVRALLNHYEQKIPFPTKSSDYICSDDGFLVKELPQPREFPCRYEETIVAKIGPMVLVAMQGEVCAPIGKAIKDKYRGEMPIMVFAYMGEHNLYIPTRALVKINAYQAQVIQTQYASPVGWSPDIEDEMVKGVEKMIDGIIH